MEENKNSPDNIPYIVYEGEMARSERHIKRLIFSLIISILLLAVSNGIWLYAWMQYDYTSDSIAVDSRDGGNANYIGTSGSIYNGEGNSQE